MLEYLFIMIIIFFFSLLYITNFYVFLIFVEVMWVLLYIYVSCLSLILNNILFIVLGFFILVIGAIETSIGISIINYINQFELYNNKKKIKKIIINGKFK